MTGVCIKIKMYAFSFKKGFPGSELVMWNCLLHYLCFYFGCKTSRNTPFLSSVWSLYAQGRQGDVSGWLEDLAGEKHKGGCSSHLLWDLGEKPGACWAPELKLLLCSLCWHEEGFDVCRRGSPHSHGGWGWMAGSSGVPGLLAQLCLGVSELFSRSSCFWWGREVDLKSNMVKL